MTLENNDIYRRALQFQERRYFCTPNSVNYLVIRIKGDVSEDLLKKAIFKCQTRHKLLQARVFIKEKSDIWLTNEKFKDIEFESIQRKNDNQWLEKCIFENSVYFDYYSQPLIKFILIYSKEISELIIKTDHMFADGLGFSYLARDLFEFLENPSKKVEILRPPPLVNKDIIPSDVSDNVFAKKVIKYVNKRWKKNQLILTKEDYRELFDSYWNKYKTKYEQINLTKKQTTKLLYLCKKHKVTVNTVLFTALIRAQSDIVSNKQKKGGISLSTRDRLNENLDGLYGFYATGIFLSFKNNPNKSFWEQAKDFHKKFNEKLNKKTYLINLLRFNQLDSSINDGIIVKMFGDIISDKYKNFDKLSTYSKKKDVVSFILNWTVNKHFDFGLTNLGSIDLKEKYGDLNIDRVYYLPHTSPSTDIILSAVSSSGKLSIGIAYIENIIERSTIYKVKRYLKELLEL